ncbi:hypothetical protein AN958_10319 [Leucoagaricus sp. SymC.cos]|nr:hypothetical protein AN958_10319 [Leucoagaricus sp. SymC.cos]
MRFYSKDFPWSLEINTPQKDISCSDIWNAIWALMQQPIEDSEWGLLCTSGEAGKKRIEEIKKANKKRLDLNSFADKRILRCDYLGENVWFAGLEKDDDYAKARPLPGTDFAKHPVLEDTWMMKVKK